MYLVIPRGTILVLSSIESQLLIAYSKIKRLKIRNITKWYFKIKRCIKSGIQQTVHWFVSTSNLYENAMQCVTYDNRDMQLWSRVFPINRGIACVYSKLQHHPSIVTWEPHLCGRKPSLDYSYPIQLAWLIEIWVGNCMLYLWPSTAVNS